MSNRLSTLESLYQQTVMEPENGKTYALYIGRLRYTHSTHSDSNDLDVRLDLLKYWHYHLEHSAQYYAHPSLRYSFDAINDIAKYIQFVSKYKLVDAIIRDERQSRILAFACLTRVKHSWECLTEDSKYTVADVLQQWTAASLDPEVVESLPLATDFIYGQAVWPLYSSDCDAYHALPAILLNAKLRPILRSGVPSLPALPVSIPTDLS